jgi:AcrR family transcriptional regulator
VAGDHDQLSAGRPGIGDELAARVLGTLSPTARRILKAAYRVLERDGYEGLSLRRIAAEAGETRSLILYHFESKAGLVATLVDSLWHDADIALMEQVAALAADPRGRVLALTGLHRQLALQPGLYSTYFDLLPHVLRDHDARSRLMRTYRSYRRIGELCLAPAVADETRRNPMATMLLAIGEGMPVRSLLTGEAGDVSGDFAVLERRLLLHLGLEPVDVPPLAVTPGGPRGDSLRDLKDPAAELTPAAGRVLDAALALLSEAGPQALTAETLARKSGEPSSSVFYHFGDKHGLVATVVAAGDHRVQQALVKAARPFASRPQPLTAVADIQARFLAQHGWMRTFVDVFPVILRDEGLRHGEAAFQERVRCAVERFVRDCGVAGGEARSLASLVVALMHGLAIQHLVDPRGTQVEAAVDVWRELLRQPPGTSS